MIVTSENLHVMLVTRLKAQPERGIQNTWKTFKSQFQMIYDVIPIPCYHSPKRPNVVASGTQQCFSHSRESRCATMDSFASEQILAAYSNDIRFCVLKKMIN